MGGEPPSRMHDGPERMTGMEALIDLASESVQERHRAAGQPREVCLAGRSLRAPHLGTIGPVRGPGDLAAGTIAGEHHVDTPRIVSSAGCLLDFAVLHGHRMVLEDAGSVTAYLYTVLAIVVMQDGAGSGAD